MIVSLFVLACAEPTADTSAGDSAGDTDTDDGGGDDTGDGGDDTGDGGDDSGDTGDTHDTAVNDPDTGADDADITGNFNGTAFVMNFEDAIDPDIRCQESGDYFFMLQDAAGKYQLSVNVAQPVEGETVTYPSLGTNTFSLGEVGTWALDTTFHGRVHSAHVTVDTVKPTIRVTGSFEVSWDADGGAGLPAANASGTFDLGCR